MAANIRQPGSETQQAIDERIEPVTVATVANSPQVLEIASEAAAELIMSNTAIVLETDVGAPSFNYLLQKYRVGYWNRAKQLIAGWTADNYFDVLKGISFGGRAKVQAWHAGAFAIRGKNGRMGELALDHSGNVPAWVLERWAARFPGVPVKVMQVRPIPGAGEHASPKLAVDAINALGLAAKTRPYVVVVHPGVYTETDWVVPGNVELLGTEVGFCILDGSQPDSVGDGHQNTSTLWLKDGAELTNLTILMRNGRYAVHSENSGQSPNARHDPVNCHIQHLGNDGMRTWRAANPGSGLSVANVWTADRAWGYGASSGMYQRYESTTMLSNFEAFYVHDNADFAAPIRHDFINCRILSVLPTGKIEIQSLGSGQSSTVNMNGTETNALHVNYSDTPWISTNPENLVADHAQIVFRSDGNDMLGFSSTCRGRALRIRSSSTGATSSVAASGTAAAAILGGTRARRGGGGLAGYLWGRWDISGITVGPNGTTTVANTLGRRLGNCTTTPKTLTVTVDGGAPITITFSA
ncbi:hypothetical protein B0T42_07185, partial [Rathayibacter sp. VKM Ac-2630]